MNTKPLVLIVEDNFDLAEAARRYLQIKRYNVLISDGKDLSQILLAQRPDIIII